MNFYKKEKLFFVVINFIYATNFAFAGINGGIAQIQMRLMLVIDNQPWYALGQPDMLHSANEF